MQRIRASLWTSAVLFVMTTTGCGNSEPTAAVSKVADPDSPEFLKAQEDANRTLKRQQHDEARLRKRRKLPQDE